MLRAAATIVLVGLAAIPLGAQGPYRDRGARGVPQGQLPLPGTCRVWYDGVPAGRQPAPMNCRDAERIASRDRNARVIYGSDDRWDGNSGYPYPDRDRGRYTYGPAFSNGYEDGYDKGRDDGRDRDRFDPNRHSRYRSADHGYERRYGSKDVYRNVYRDGFRDGYQAGYREGRRNDRDWWPF